MLTVCGLCLLLFQSLLPSDTLRDFQLVFIIVLTAWKDCGGTCQKTVKQIPYPEVHLIPACRLLFCLWHAVEQSPHFSPAYICFFLRQHYLTGWVAFYLRVMVGHWLPSTCHDYNDLGGAGAWNHWFKGKREERKMRGGFHFTLGSESFFFFFLRTSFWTSSPPTRRMPPTPNTLNRLRLGKWASLGWGSFEGKMLQKLWLGWV